LASKTATLNPPNLNPNPLSSRAVNVLTSLLTTSPPPGLFIASAASAVRTVSVAVAPAINPSKTTLKGRVVVLLGS
jgi:hypothetical protein